METEPFYRSCLRGELEKRCEKNPRYSLRSFARALKIDPGAASWILSGKRIPTYKLSQRILSSLNLSPKEVDGFMASVAETQRARGLKRAQFAFWRQSASNQAVLKLNHELFRVISDWYNYAILELSLTEGFESSPAWIAKELGISPTQAKLAIERLLRVGLLEAHGERFSKVDLSLTTQDKKVTGPALRSHQRQVLEKAIESLENDPIEERSMTSMTMAIDPEKLPMAKQMIEQFTQAVCDYLESGSKRQVYQLGISLYPLQKKRSRR